MTPLEEKIEEVIKHLDESVAYQEGISLSSMCPDLKESLQSIATQAVEENHSNCDGWARLEDGVFKPCFICINKSN